MKKTYQKPMLYAETFEMLEHIASNCTLGDGVGYSVTYRESGGTQPCAYTDNGTTIYLSNTEACLDSFDDRQWDSFDAYLSSMLGGGQQCYNAFQSGKAFAS